MPIRSYLRKAGFACLLTLGVSSGLALAGQEVRYGGATGYLATPPAKANTFYPSVILVHEWWGLNQWIKDQADKLAELGYIALAVDLYDGQVFTRKQKRAAKKSLRSLSVKKSMTAVFQGTRYLARLKNASGNIGIVGWGMGGGMAMESALRFSDLKSAVIIYGSVVTEPTRLATLDVPILGIFGRDDSAVPDRKIKEFSKRLTELTKPHTVKIYPKVGHAFMNENNKSGFDDSSARLAWREIDKFLSANLR